METIKAAEKALKDVFCDHYVFRIPPYQRPYSWTTEQAGDLLDDLIWAAGDDKRPAERPPYFLGSIVVIKDPNYPVADVVDGQQRLTTLTILMSVLRELAGSDEEKANIDIFLRQKGNALLDTKDIPRLTVRPRCRVLPQMHPRGRRGWCTRSRRHRCSPANDRQSRFLPRGPWQDERSGAQPSTPLRGTALLPRPSRGVGSDVSLSHLLGNERSWARSHGDRYP
jgi:hypothetical protein